MQKTYHFFCYPYESSKPQVYLEYNTKKLNLNEAEAKALQQIEYRNKKTELKNLRQKEFFKKCNKSALIYEEEQRMKNREEQILKKKEQVEQNLKKQNFNKAVYQNNMKPFLKEKEKAQTINIQNKSNQKRKKIANKNKKNMIKKEKGGKSFDRIKRREVKDNEEIETKELLEHLNENEIKNKADKDSNLYNKNNLNLNKAKIIQSSNTNNNVIDLRIGLENQVLEEIKLKNLLLANNELLDKVDDKITTIKKFRTSGLLPEEFKSKSKNKKKEKNKKQSSEFERRRFIKAINNIINEKLSEKNLEIKKICNCGNLQKKLNSMIEKDNLDALKEIDCDKNCSFYNNKDVYLEGINSVLKIIKDIYLDNKNKDEE